MITNQRTAKNMYSDESVVCLHEYH